MNSTPPDREAVTDMMPRCLNSSWSIFDVDIKGKCECVHFNIVCEIELVDISLDYIVKAM